MILANTNAHTHTYQIESIFERVSRVCECVEKFHKDTIIVECRKSTYVQVYAIDTAIKS